MRRHFRSDEEIPAVAWELFPELKEKLDRITEMERKIGSSFGSRKRLTFALNSEPEVRTKILRVHLRHQFLPSTAIDRAHFLITIEGHLLDKSTARTLTFGNFLDKIRVQLDKRFHPVNNVYEWSAESFPEGIKGHCFRVKVYGDKPFPIKVFLHRSNDVRSRYELSPLLRDVLPSIQIDPTEEQVLLALWGHLSSTGLLEGRDRRQIKCSVDLKNLFGVDSLSMSALRQRISEQLSVCKPIHVEYNVTTNSTVLSTSFGPNAVAKGGGKAFDIEVDVRDPYAFDLLESVNDIARTQREMIETVSQIERKASFLAGSIIDCSNNLFAMLSDLQSSPFGLHVSSSSKTQRDPLLCTATGDSVGFPLRPSMPSETLQRASDLFSRISTRSAPSPSKDKRIIRPQRRPGTVMRLPPTPSTAASVVGATASFSAVVTSEEHDSDMPSSSSSPPVTTSANATESKIVIVPSSSASNITDTGIDTRLVAMNDKETDSKSTLSDDTSNGKIAVIEGLEISTAKTKTEIEEEDIEDRMDVEVAEERKSNEQLDGKEDQALLAVYVKQENRENIITVEKGEGTASNVLSVARDEIDVTMMIEDSVPTPVKGEGEEDSAPTTTATSTSTLVSLEEKGENIIINMVALESEIEVAESKYLTSSSSSISPAPQVELIKIASLPPTTLPRAPDFLSAIHGLRGYLDVGSDALYTSTEPWVPATASLLAKRKLARN